MEFLKILIDDVAVQGDYTPLCFMDAAFIELCSRNLVRIQPNDALRGKQLHEPDEVPDVGDGNGHADDNIQDHNKAAGSAFGHLNLRYAAEQAGDEDEHESAERDSNVGLVVELVAAVKKILVLDPQGFKFLACAVASLEGGPVLSILVFTLCVFFGADRGLC